MVLEPGIAVSVSSVVAWAQVLVFSQSLKVLELVEQVRPKSHNLF